jgi:hypothetical protein
VAADRDRGPGTGRPRRDSRLSVGQCPQALPLGRPWRPMHHYRVQALARAWQRAIMLRLEGMRDTAPPFSSQHGLGGIASRNAGSTRVRVLRWNTCTESRSMERSVVRGGKYGPSFLRPDYGR